MARRGSMALPGWELHAGESHPNARVTNEIVRYIRRSKKSAARLAKKFGVSKAAIYDIRAKRRWRHVTDDEEVVA